jgi:hypothetical protein
VTKARNQAGEDRRPAPGAFTEDDTGRHIAWQLSRNGDWLVIWGPWSRQWWAFPRFAGGTVIHSGDHDDLVQCMRLAAVNAWRPVGRGG